MNLLKCLNIILLCACASVVFSASEMESNNRISEPKNLECVVLLHGLARRSSSMEVLHDTLVRERYFVVNQTYPSREHSISDLAELAINDAIKACKGAGAKPVNFVTHSLGGILVRQYFSQHNSDIVHRVVMLGPPNNGSEAVDNLKRVPGFEWVGGPAGLQLGTDDSSIPSQLGPVNFELGVIAGTASFNKILSLYLPGEDDGKVSVDSTKVKGMCDFIALPTSHPFMMKNTEVLKEVIRFLKSGSFSSGNVDDKQGVNKHCH